MNEGLKMVIGMSFAYLVSFAGLILAYFAYKKHHRQTKEEKRDE